MLGNGPRSLTSTFLCLALLGILLTDGTLLAGPAPTGRRTTDRDADLISALIESGQTEAAAEICQRHLAVHPPGSASNAAWSIRLSAVRVAALQAAGSDDETAWDNARKPLEQALSGYEAEPPAPWIELQRLLVSLARSDQRAMQFLANPSDTATRNALLEEIRATVEGLRALDSRLAEMIPLSDAGRLAGAAPAQDLIHLQQTVRRRIVEALLLRADAYPAGSDDALAAATEAEQLAGSLLDAGAGDLQSREAAVRTWAETRRRAENPQGAIELLAEWLSTHGTAEPETLAQLVLAELHAGKREQAEQRLRTFYGDDPTTAPPSTEMDLARLRYFISGRTESAEDRQQIAAWIEQIERRNGAYARRRAETEMLRVVRVRPSEGNATLMAAQAGQLLRDGGDVAIRQAAQLLHEASVAAGDSAEGFRWGLQSGAALVKLARHAEASDAFAETAIRSPTQPQASAVHFEAARQWSKHIAAATTAAPQAPATESSNTESSNTESSNTESVAAESAAAELIGRLESLLVDHLRRWPESPEAVHAREWLVKIYEAAQRFDDAARVALQLPAGAIQWPAAIAQSGQLWRQALAAAEPAEARAEIGRQALASWKVVPPAHAPLAAKEANLICALAFSRDALRSTWNDQPTAEPAGDFANDLRRVRLEGVDPQTVALGTADFPDQQTVIELGLRRLRDDAAEHPRDRTRMARGMLRMVEGSGEEALSQHPLIADALALSGQWQEAAARWERLATGSPRRPEMLRHGAQLLGSLDDPAANRRAIEMWNRLAQGLPQGTPQWHEAKLGAANLLKKLGQGPEAAKMAKFVLLTQPPKDEATRASYERLATGK